ncbi:MAG: MG2 domain-containing protein [Thermoanaerobaculia bacterium]
MNRFLSSPSRGAAFVPLLLVALAAGARPAVAAPDPATLARPAGVAGSVVVPDHTLRAFDPLTVFFDRDAGPAGGGDEDSPETWVRLAPEHPGAWRWLDARTLQFRPAEAWPPLARFRVTVDGRNLDLVTLAAAPRLADPPEQGESPRPVGAIRLVFPAPIDPAVLRSMVTVELRPLPGIDARGARFLGEKDFSVRALDRAGAGDEAAYLLELAQPIPNGQRVLLHVRRSLDLAQADSTLDFQFTTAAPFRVVSLDCGSTTVPVGTGGTSGSRSEPIACGSDSTELHLVFSAAPAALDPVVARNLVRIDPPVEEFSASPSGSYLTIRGRFAVDTLYRLTLAPTELVDGDGRPLEMARPSTVYLVFPHREAYLRWGAGQGILERYGPQQVPIEGRGDERVDVRVHRVDPLDRNFWPWPSADRPLEIGEDSRPPGPGEEPADWNDRSDEIPQESLVEHLRLLGSPPVSSIVTLPLAASRGAARFGLDLAPSLEKIAGKGAPGTYLVGLRRLDRSSTRSWVRLTVTDLALSTYEEPAAVDFVVTSIVGAAPIEGAAVRVEGPVRSQGTTEWQTIFEGTTDAAGHLRWAVPGFSQDPRREVRRLVVRKGDDVLALDVANPPDRFHDGQWVAEGERWLGWTVESLAGRGEPAAVTAHVFSDRPVYRPEETVHLAGYVRRREAGALSIPSLPAASTTLVIVGPGDLVWRNPVEISALGSFHFDFAGDQLPTGNYTATLSDAKGVRLGETSFRLEAYRLPRFEVTLDAPERAPLDREFPVSLVATYFAGGRVAGRPIAWRVTQFPYTWAPKPLPGFLYSSDGRFSRSARFESSPRLEREDTTDGEGGARLVLNPAIEPTAQPRSYVVEATVTGEDDQTVTATRRILALPPFVVGMKVPRYLEQAREIAPQVVIAGPDGELLAGRELTVRLIHRQWHSVLKASDFSDGVARYLTDVVDEKIAEKKVSSAGTPLAVPFPIVEPGVYLVEVEAVDRLGRSQLVAADLYAGGVGAVSWARPPQGTFTATPDKKSYATGEVANFVLQSPFQQARALAIVEAPEGNRYEWLEVAGGVGRFRLSLAPTWTPRLPVHFVLLRGRLPGVAPQAGSVADLGKPTTAATTVWLDVDPRANRIAVELASPERARPGQTIEIEIRLKDPDGHPLAGEAALWLVDAAVLSLGREARLDPLPDFLRSPSTWLDLHDSRNLAFGYLPYAETPGGDSGEEKEADLLSTTTVRKNFQPVPYWNPAIPVGADGVARVSVRLPDDLTVFRLRAKAISGPERFGFATGELAVRLPVIAQPALPRFARPGDQFTAAAIGRVVEGEGGAGRAQIEVRGATLSSPAERTLDLVPDQPTRIEFEVAVPQPALTGAGELASTEMIFRAAVERKSDGAADAFEVKLPIRDDRERVADRQLAEIAAGGELKLTAIPTAIRAGSARRSIFLSGEPGVVRLAAGLDYQRGYPFGCTEQRLSIARSEIALKSFQKLLATGADSGRADRSVRDTLAWLPGVIDGNGLCSFWPGSEGSVWLTAYAAEFVGAAKSAGYAVDEKLLAGLTATLQKALRSDYGHFVDGEDWTERAAALAALARLGKLDAAYAGELARRTDMLNLEATAGVLAALERAPSSAGAASDALAQRVWDGIVFRSYQGREIFGGLAETALARNGLLLPSDTRALATAIAAFAPRADVQSPRFRELVDGLVTLGTGDGWGSTNANAAALVALSDLLKPPFAGATAHRLEVGAGERRDTIALGPDRPAAALAFAAASGGGAIRHLDGSGPVVARVETSWLPAEDGSREAPAAAGFVVARELVRVAATGELAERLALDSAGREIRFAIGDLVEEHVQVVNPAERHFVAVEVPLAAGVEPLNPALATAPPEAAARGKNTRRPTYVELLDDRMVFYFDHLPAGTYDLYFRTRATTAGRFVQPAARAVAMYDETVRGNSAGARLVIARPAP